MISSQAHQGSPRLRLPEASVTSQTSSLQAGHQAPSQRGSFDLSTPGCGAGSGQGVTGPLLLPGLGEMMNR